MTQEGYLWMPCTIENSGFSSERRFTVNLGDGGKAVGTAYVEYLLDEQERPIPEGHPPYGQVIRGKVKCRVIKRDGEKVYIEFPGTDVFHVPSEALMTSR